MESGFCVVCRCRESVGGFGLSSGVVNWWLEDEAVDDSCEG